MQWLLFLSRVAFICNVAFLLSLLLQWRPLVSNQALVSTIVLAGYFIAPFLLSPIVNVLYAVVWLQNKPLTTRLPKWLVLANFGFLLVQVLFVLFFLHDPFHS